MIRSMNWKGSESKKYTFHLHYYNPEQNLRYPSYVLYVVDSVSRVTHLGFFRITIVVTDKKGLVRLRAERTPTGTDVLHLSD